jgi:hypothetical protein
MNMSNHRGGCSGTAKPKKRWLALSLVERERGGGGEGVIMGMADACLGMNSWMSVWTVLLVTLR